MIRGKAYLVFPLALMSCALLRADYKADVGYTSLSARLGGSTPTGAGIAVTQIEAPNNSTPPFIYHPDETAGEFAGKTFSNECLSCDNVNFSGHATTVGTFYYGILTSMAPGITTVDVNEANNWMSIMGVGTPS